MGTSERKYGYRPTPQLSASQIAEYLGATAPRRKTIIRDAKFPKTSVVAQYEKSREGITNFLNDGARSLNHLAKATDYLARREARPDATDWIKRDNRFSTEAIEVFQRTYNKTGLSKLSCQAVTSRLPALEVGPTKITVSLDVLIQKPTENGKSIGGALLVFSRGEASTKSRIDRCKTLAGLIYIFCSTHLKGLGTADASLCMAVDVFAGASVKPPGTFVKRMRQITDSCEEIAANWDRIEAPEDYDGPPL